jgi:glycosyltransferase involved in cell wall biosynthesis
VDIQLITEGTYPHQFGGVSVWCDQLVRGMPEHGFHVTGLVATGDEVAKWDVPEHVTWSNIALWGPTPRGRRLRGRTAGRFASIYRDLIEALLGPADGGPDDTARFGAALRDLLEFHRTHDVVSGLSGEEPVRLMLAGWSGDAEMAAAGLVPTVHDALTAVDMVDHALRPLLAQPRRAALSHAVTNGLATLPGIASKWTYGTPLLLTEHGIYLRERYLGHRRTPYSWPVKSLVLRLYRRMCHLAYAEAALITPGNRYNQRWELRGGAPADRLRTVYNGVDPAHFPAAGAEPEVPTITWAGRVDPIKDLETLIRSFALVRQEIPDVRLRMFGGGSADYRALCERLIDELGLIGAAVFEGRVDNIRDAYAAGHVVVLSSISEGFPYTLIEAMTSGRATVSTDVGGVTEAVADTGLVVPPRDPAAIAQGCVNLLRDPALRRLLGAAARSRALELFTVEQAVDSFKAIYADLADGAAAGRERDGAAA